MAISVRQVATGSAGATAAITPTLSSAAVAGNVLIAISAQASWQNDTTFDEIAGYGTVISSGPATGNGNLGWLVVAKIAAGGETSVTAPADSGQGNHTAALIEIEGFTGTAKFDAIAQDVSNRATVTDAQSSGTATATAAGFAVAIFMSDAHTSVDADRAYTNGFSEVLSAPGNTRPGIMVATKAVAAGNVSCTFSTSEGDEMVGCIVVLVDDTGGGDDIELEQSAAEALVLAEQQGTLSLSIPLAQGAPEALALTEHGGTVGLSIPLIQSAPEALVITELGGTLEVGSDIQLVQSAPEALALAEQGGTVGLSMPLAQAAPEALVITEHGGAISLGTPIALTQSAPEALTLTEHAGQLSLSMPLVQSAPEALVLTEWPGTIPGAVEAELPPQGGHYWPDVEYDDFKERSAKERRLLLRRLIEGAENAPEPVREEIKEVIAPYQKKGAMGFSVSQKGIARLATNLAAVERLIAAYQEYLDDEDATVLLLVA